MTYNYQDIDKDKPTEISSETYINDYISTIRWDQKINYYFNGFENLPLSSQKRFILPTSSKIEENGDIVNFLDGPVCHSGFERLN